MTDQTEMQALMEKALERWRAKGTPGPWNARWDGEGGAFVTGNRQVVANMMGADDHKANAALIAAAPYMAARIKALEAENGRLRGALRRVSQPRCSPLGASSEACGPWLSSGPSSRWRAGRWPISPPTKEQTMTDAGKRLIAEAEEAKAEFERAGGKSLAQVKAEMMTDAPEHPPTTSAEWKPFFPPLMFADYIGPEERWFAWRPVRLWDTSVRWLCYVHRRRALPHEYLTNSGGAFWVYTKELRA